MHINSRILNEMFFSGVVAKRSLEPIWGNEVSEYWGAGPSSARKLWRAGQAELGTNMGRGGVLEYWRGAMRNVTGCCAKVREVSRKSTKVRTDQGRGYAMLRIVTGGTFFSKSERLEACLDVNGMRKRMEIMVLQWRAGFQ